MSISIRSGSARRQIYIVFLVVLTPRRVYLWSFGASGAFDDSVYSFDNSRNVCRAFSFSTFRAILISEDLERGNASIT